MAKMTGFPNKGTRIREYPLAAAQSFKEGSCVVLANGAVSECGADPAAILGLACHDAGAEPNTSRILVWIAEADTTFFMAASSAPVVADEGDQYGLAKDGDGIWHVDKTEAVNTRVVVETADVSRGLLEVKILPANRQLG